MDGDGTTDRITQSVLLPSGVDVEEEDAVKAQVEESQKETKLSVDMSFSLMMQADQYSEDFKATVGMPFEANSNKNSHKMAAFRGAIAEMKGSSSHNSVIFCRSFQLAISLWSVNLMVNFVAKAMKAFGHLRLGRREIRSLWRIWRWL